MLNAIEIGKRIKTLQEKKGWKQIELIEKTCISKGAISNYISGNRVPSSEELLKISKALDTTMEWILTGKHTNENLSETEKELIEYFRKLPEREQDRELGRLEAKTEQYQEQEKSSSSRTG